MAATTWTRNGYLLLWEIAMFFATATGQYSSWSPWSECSKKCDGEQIRTRQCVRSSADCGEDLTDRRECGQASWNSGCFSQFMIIALAVIGAAIIVAITLIILLCRRNEKVKKNNKLEEAKNITEAIEKKYDNAVFNPLHAAANSMGRRFPALSSFPDPLKEPEEMDLDNFAFDQESLNESIQSMSLAFGTDEEYQPGRAPTKDEVKPMALKVVSVTETQVIDRDDATQRSEEKAKEENKPPLYAVVVKPKKDDKPNIAYPETQIIDIADGSHGNEEKAKKDDKPPIYEVVVKPKKDDKPDIADAGTLIIDIDGRSHVNEEKTKEEDLCSRC
ncbi:uncharacterized protein [Montipora foliosa]|uniref:uncharacterized protein n=1 Tax=Montipora foliosa TaxID=591990 RepID=UPI0035F15258